MKDRALVVVCTCARPRLSRFVIWDYFCFARSNPGFDLVVSIDGPGGIVRKACRKAGIACIHSKRREGVGIAKNRAFQSYPDYSHYFFLDDDVELAAPAVFQRQIEASIATGIHHFSLGARHRFRTQSGTSIASDVSVEHFAWGSGAFSYFTGDALRKIGGWHREFARYRRFGHSEHSLRIVNAGLAPAPFNVVSALWHGYFRWHNPPSVSRVPSGVQIDNNGIADVEVRLIQERLRQAPFATISRYYVTPGHNRLPSPPWDPSAPAAEKVDKNPLLSAEDRSALKQGMGLVPRQPRSILRSAVTRIARLLGRA